MKKNIKTRIVQLFEIFNTNTFTWYYINKNGYSLAIFYVDGNKYECAFYKLDDKAYSISFYLVDNNKYIFKMINDYKKVFKVLSNVKNIIVSFIEKEKPNFLGFITTEYNRKDIYLKLLFYLQKKYEYNVYSKDIAKGLIFYISTLKDNEKLSKELELGFDENVKKGI